jgi:hypothetical protein
VKQAQYYRQSKLQILAWRTAKRQKSTAVEGCRVYTDSQKSSQRISGATPVLGTYLHVPEYYGLGPLHARDSSDK